jgi:hypothetical protein
METAETLTHYPHCRMRYPVAPVSTCQSCGRPRRAAVPAETALTAELSRSKVGKGSHSKSDRTAELNGLVLEATPISFKGAYGMATFSILDFRPLPPRLRLPYRGAKKMRDAVMDLACIILCIAFALWIGWRQVRKL